MRSILRPALERFLTPAIEKLQQCALSSTASFFNGWRSTPGTMPATSQLDKLISITAISVAVLFQDDTGLAQVVRGLDIGGLHRFHISDDGCFFRRPPHSIYYTMPGVLHALCNAHHLRELKALVEIEKEDWARQRQRLLRRACHAANLARERGAPLKPSLIALTERRYDAVLAEGMAFHEAQTPLARPVTGGRKPRGRAPRRTGHNLLLRLATRKQDTLRFLRDPTVPFTNNQAERDGRMMKLRQKISGGFRSVEGAVDFALIRSFFSTAKSRAGPSSTP